MRDREKQRPVLSRRQLRQLASTKLMGAELLKEIEALERRGVVFKVDYADKEGVYVDHVRYLLLGETDADEDGLGVQSLRAEALAKAKQDPDFLKIRIGDFLTEIRLDERGQEEVYIARHERALLGAVARLLGHEGSGYQRFEGAYWPEVDAYAEAYQDDWGHVPERFLQELREKEPTWLDLLRHPDEQMRTPAIRSLGDPGDPEHVVVTLIAHRLYPLVEEYRRVVLHERELARQQAELAAKEAESQRVDDAWSGFFANAPAETPAPEKPRHARGVAEMLGDLDR